MKVIRLGCGVLFAAAVTVAAGAAERVPLPEGDNGIAARYPGDAGISADPAVVFIENFEEGSVGAVKSRWEDSGGQMELVAETPAGSSGKSSVLMTHVGGKGTGSMLWRRIKNKSGGYGYDTLFLRSYVRFDPDCNPLHHFGCNLGGRNPVGPKWPMGNAGLRPTGADRFSTGPETDGKNWKWDWYNYWGEMRSWNNPDGTGSSFYGNDFFAKLRPPVAKGKWICVEFMIKLNTPVTERNGEMALWIDGCLVRAGGQVIGHHGPGFPNGHWIRDSWVPRKSDPPFEGLKWRKTADLKINTMGTTVYITKAPAGKVSKVWFDDIVLATKYVGPIATRKATQPKAEVEAAAPKSTPEARRNAIAEKEAGRLFQMARQAERMGQKAVARSLYQQIVEKHAGTGVAEKARAKLD